MESAVSVIYQHETNGRPFALLVHMDPEKPFARITCSDVSERQGGDPDYDIIVMAMHPVEIKVEKNTLIITRMKEVKINAQ